MKSIIILIILSLLSPTVIEPAYHTLYVERWPTKIMSVLDGKYEYWMVRPGGRIWRVENDKTIVENS